VVGISLGALVALCCGGTVLIGVFSDPPADPKPAPTAAVAPLAAPVTSAAAPTSSRTPASPTVQVSSPAPRKTTTRPATQQPKPKPKVTTRRPTPKPTRTTRAPEPADVYYVNCAAVRAAGAAPIRRGDPGYSRKLDRDGDGVGCED